MEQPLLVTGAAGGIGKFIHERLGGLTLTRDNLPVVLDYYRQTGFRTIIHCAYNSTSPRKLNSQNIFGYLTDNVLLTGEALSIPHEYFVYFSSVEVYPKNNALHTEDELIDIADISNFHGIAKMLSESIVTKRANRFLILRCCSLVGKYARKNNLSKLLEDKHPTLTLSPDSNLNYVLYEDILSFIRIAISQGIGGIFNIASASAIKLGRAVEIIGKEVKFGEVRYDVGNISNKKAVSVLNNFSLTSEQILKKIVRSSSL